MHKITRILLCMIFAFAMLIPQNAQLKAEAAYYKSFYYTVHKDGTIRITSYTGSAKSVTVPSTINGKKVTRIGDAAFHKNTKVEKITLPNTLKWIEGEFDADGAFYDCTNLKSISFPDSLLSVGSYAFQGCTKLTTLKFGKNLERLRPYSFIGCSGLKTVTFQNKLTLISEFSFAGCKNLSSVKLPESLKTIGAGAFFGNEQLKSITIPKSVTKIGNYAVGFSNHSKKGYVKTGGVTVTYYSGTAGMDYVSANGLKGKEIAVATSMTKCKITLSGTSYTYSGKAITPTVTVKNSSKTLKKNTHYTVTYQNNTKAGTAKVIIKGKSPYTGSVTKTFKIMQKSISSVTVTSSNYLTYTGKPITATLSVTSGKTKLKSGTDYQVTYQSNTNVGQARYTIKGKGNYTGTRSGVFYIIPVNISKTKITAEPVEQDTDTPSIKVTYNGKTLKKNTDYTVQSVTPIEPDTLQMAITGKGNYCGKTYVNVPITIPETTSAAGITEIIAGTLMLLGVLGVSARKKRKFFNKRKVLSGVSTCMVAAVVLFSFSVNTAPEVTAQTVVTDTIAKAYASADKKKAAKIKITLDPGHVKDYNRFTYFSNYSEGTQMWKLACELKKELESYGFVVVTTRPKVTDFLEVAERGQLAGNNGSDLFLSLHSNAGGSSASGVEIYYSMSDQNNKVLSDKLGKAIAKTMGTSFNGSKNRHYPGATGVDYYGVCRNAAFYGCTAAFLVEHGFHTNYSESSFLKNSSSLKKLAKAEAKVIAEYYDVI